MALVVIAVICAIAILSWFFTFKTSLFSSDPKGWADFGTYVGGVLSPLFAAAAFLGLWKTIQQQTEAHNKQKIDVDSESYFKHAVQNLERAYEAIAPLSGDAMPVRDRLAWLTCARLLLAAKSSSCRIHHECEGLCQLYAGEEEYWRHKFYKLLHHEGTSGIGRDCLFFQGDKVKKIAEIAEESIRVIYEFSAWRNDQADPLLSIPKYTQSELDGVKFSCEMAGIKKYILSKGRFKSPNR
nr:hypothetical protein [uncultured Deefgea sp.]